jgi:hypothetical protein
MENETVTGYQYCDPCTEKFAEGYLGLVEATNPTHGEQLAVDEAYRTGRIAWLRRHVAAQMFNIPLTDNMMFVFIDGTVIKIIEDLQRQAEAALEN